MSDLEAAIAAIWDRSKPIMRERVEHVDRAAAALRDGPLDPAVREEASRAAHQLAGSLGSFGMPEGSDVARALEQLLRTDRPPEPTADTVDPLLLQLHRILDPRLA
ncbi:MAG TPA: Hpt domain-containing protein [Solirubrobacteraceae bacterium]|nr:Hpt domain-containing protein [Solirubrobacteraceae bacterium]